jgi:2-(1,2-epoxy-1,2-dihydrophenyl)acetyl-CoA isomerase
MKNLDTGTEHLIAKIENNVGYLIMNRPEARNAMSSEMNGALQEKIAEFELDEEVRCVVLTGAGNAFCAGGDVKGMNAKNEGDSEKDTIDKAIHRQRDNQRGTSGKLYKMPKPTIASLPGAAAGAGLSYALSCDLRIMSSTAFMTTAFAKVGFSGDYGGTYFMSQLIGSAKARELYFLSDRVSAEEALSLGLTNWVVDADNLEAKTKEIAEQLATGPSVAYRYMKENLNRAMNGDVDECLDLEATHHVHCGQTTDHKNAVKAFVEKQQPKFSGK